jgi:uncharacterized FlgJ-related protein
MNEFYIEVSKAREKLLNDMLNMGDANDFAGMLEISDKLEYCIRMMDHYIQTGKIKLSDDKVYNCCDGIFT